MPDLAIETRNLRKVFGSKVAVSDLTLEVPRGEVFGFLGPNGAGKSTSVKMLLGLVKPTGGEAKILGAKPHDSHMMAHVGFLPEHFRFHEWLTASELLDLHGRLNRMDMDKCRKRIPEVLDLVGLLEHANRPISGFSKGMLQRIGLAQALIHSPQLVFFDEPTSALDPFGRRLVRSIIQDLKLKGTTVFLNSHLLSEVEITCDRVAFIKAGSVLQTVVLKELETSHFNVVIRVDVVTSEILQTLENAGTSWKFLDEDETTIRSSHHSRNMKSTLLELTLESEERLPELAQSIISSGTKLYELTPKHTSLEQLFLDIIGMEDSGQ